MSCGAGASCDGLVMRGPEAMRGAPLTIFFKLVEECAILADSCGSEACGECMGGERAVTVGLWNTKDEGESEGVRAEEVDCEDTSGGATTFASSRGTCVSVLLPELLPLSCLSLSL